MLADAILSTLIGPLHSSLSLSPSLRLSAISLSPTYFMNQLLSLLITSSAVRPGPENTTDSPAGEKEPKKIINRFKSQAMHS